MWKFRSDLTVSAKKPGNCQIRSKFLHDLGRAENLTGLRLLPITIAVRSKRTVENAPRQWKGLGEHRQVWGCSRRCLRNLGQRKFRRQRLRNPLWRPSEVEQAHLFQVSLGEPAPEARGQIRCQTLQQGLPVSRPLLPALFKLDDAPPDLPIGWPSSPH